MVKVKHQRFYLTLILRNIDGDFLIGFRLEDSTKWSWNTYQNIIGLLNFIPISKPTNLIVFDIWTWIRQKKHLNIFKIEIVFFTINSQLQCENILLRNFVTIKIFCSSWVTHNKSYLKYCISFNNNQIIEYKIRNKK